MVNLDMQTMPADTPEVAPECSSDAAPKLTGKLRLLTLDSLDGRTKAARLARSLVEAIETDLGGADRLSVGERQVVQRIAVLGAVMESQEAAWLSGNVLDLPGYLAAINAQRRCIEAVGLKRRLRDVSPNLRDYLQGKTA